MLTASEQASQFANRTTTWDDTVRAEIRHTLNRIRYGHDRDLEWTRLEARLLSLCRTVERPKTCQGRKAA